MSKLTEWLRSLVGLTEADEDRIVAEGGAAITRVFSRLRECIEFELAQTQDLLTSQVHVTAVPDPPRDEQIASLKAANTHTSLVDQAFRKKLGTRKTLSRMDKTELTTLIVDAL